MACVEWCRLESKQTSGRPVLKLFPDWLVPTWLHSLYSCLQEVPPCLLCQCHSVDVIFYFPFFLLFPSTRCFLSTVPFFSLSEDPPRSVSFRPTFIRFSFPMMTVKEDCRKKLTATVTWSLGAPSDRFDADL